MKLNKAQGTIEYLVILAVIIVLGLIVTALSTNFFDSSTQVGNISNDIKLQSGTISVSEIVSTPDGNVLIELSSQKKGTINEIKVSDANQIYRVKNEIIEFDNKIFQVTTGENCEEGTYIVRDLIIEYTSEFGTEQSSIIKDVKIPCENITIEISINNGTDTTAPEINLIGSNPQNIEFGDSYTELGATANDDYDGDLTSEIQIDVGDVDTDNIGEYYVEYSVSDSSGNETTKNRNVNVIDTTGPEFEGLSPSNGAVFGTDFNIDFEVTDNHGIDFCELYFDYDDDQSSSEPNLGDFELVYTWNEESETDTYVYEIISGENYECGNHDWYINCGDASDNNTQSEIRELTEGC